MAIFEGQQVLLDLDTSVSFKEKQALRKNIIDNGGIISYIITKKVQVHLNPILGYSGQGEELIYLVHKLHLCMTTKKLFHILQNLSLHLNPILSYSVSSLN